MAAGGSHTVAVRTDGTLWAWGNNYEGQLGDGTTTDRSAPVQAGHGHYLEERGSEHQPHPSRAHRRRTLGLGQQ
ncbi:hypothetical protein [Hymenobacter sp. J193]|uniref:hypothetical protein n=1 Tax=Hymenobacter sp. J193 TaxID=2898429 RepID=UPI0035B2F7D1